MTMGGGGVYFEVASSESTFFDELAAAVTGSSHISSVERSEALAAPIEEDERS